MLRRGTRHGLRDCGIQFRGACCSEERGVICQASGDHFDFQEAVHGRDTPPAPLWDGEIGEAVSRRV